MAQSENSAGLPSMDLQETLPNFSLISNTEAVSGPSSGYTKSQNMAASPIWPEFLGLGLGLNFDSVPLQYEPFNWGNTSIETPSNESMDRQQINHLAVSELVDNTSKITNLNPNCFSLAQIDPVESKCEELNALLSTKKGLTFEGSTNERITREKLVYSIELFGRHFQRHLPIIHSASFSLSQAPRGLLLAMYCVGACYDNNIMTTEHILKAAAQVLMDIEHQPHEEKMDEPPLSAIQAGILASSVLATSQDEFSHKSVPIHFARNISMAHRARIFQSVDRKDYNTMTLETFDWDAWVDLESRIRIANALFTQNTAECIFQGKPPTFSPFDLDFSLPRYEASWEAQSASQCLEALQSTPRSELLSTVMQKLLVSNTTSEASSPFEGSSFGMFTLITGIHCIVWNAIKLQIREPWDPAKLNGASSSYEAMEASSILNNLRTNFSSHTIESLTAEIEAFSGAGRFAGENKALDTWMHWWNARQYRDHKDSSFALNPMPFWYLAKVFLLLRLCGDADHLTQSDFACVIAKSDDVKGKMQRQSKILELMSRLRHPRQVQLQRTLQANVASFMEP
ncbi:hypothetical protein LTR84_006345 [Exophiala bonariae]|uniref:Xylanolytic transcriptional activator regulatory domain-containing protein n=1 Tax=Exophiala bonariae TaxID=1690606 RepID=A0AAV9N446_9EURO|nr:hypothetical protein LTR84_006345 [Exophiala bonariae]